MVLHSWRFGVCELLWFSWKVFVHFLHKGAQMGLWGVDVLRRMCSIVHGVYGYGNSDFV